MGSFSRDRRPTARQLPRLISCIRFEEVFILQGAPLLGAIYAVDRLTVESARTLLAFAVGSCLLVAHIFVLNDWSGIHGDLRDPNRASRVFVTRGVDRGQVRMLWTALLVSSLLLLSPFGTMTMGIALMIVGLSALYSAPASQWKGVPLMSSALHFAGGLLHFLLGYSVFRVVDARSLAVGCFFALAFSGGHLIHEVRDLEGDRRNGIWTNAVRFGKARSFAAGLVLFTIADLLLVVLAGRGTVPRALIIVAVLYAFHLYWSLRAFHAGLTFESVRQLQVRYRALYAIVGVLMMASLLWS